MSVKAEPLVSVVIPVYNGEKFIADAIRSVQAQTYGNWDLTIGDNWSTDRTAAIAGEFAAGDPRIRITRYPKFVGVVESHNTAVTLISDQAKYCKILGADDWFFPTCLERLISVAEAHPTVGMVTSYMLGSRRIHFTGLPYPRTFVSGREICRMRLLEGIRVFGGPSASLIRADIVRRNRPFYTPGNYHGDNDAYLELLKDHDFGFVHEALTYLRKGEDSKTTSYLDRVESHEAGYLLELRMFGAFYLTPEELERRTRTLSAEYYQFLARNVITRRGREFWQYHGAHMKQLGAPLSYGRLALYTGGQLADFLLSPPRVIRAVYRRLRRTFQAIFKRNPEPEFAPPKSDQPVTRRRDEGRAVS
jgi:glycosyltransferase involved in cell wall biosynthesis